MPTFTATLRRFGPKGEKTGWTYIDVPLAVSEVLSPGRKTSYRVKGLLDDYPFAQVALVPMGADDGSDRQFILAINATMRRKIRKEAGAAVQVSVDVDESPMPVSDDLLTCLTDDPVALTRFRALPAGHQRYYHNWIESAKTTQTKTKRITQTVTGLSMGLDYGEMIRYFKRKTQE